MTTMTHKYVCHQYSWGAILHEYECQGHFYCRLFIAIKRVIDKFITMYLKEWTPCVFRRVYWFQFGVQRENINKIWYFWISFLCIFKLNRKFQKLSKTVFDIELWGDLINIEKSLVSVCPENKTTFRLQSAVVTVILWFFNFKWEAFFVTI